MSMWKSVCLCLPFYVGIDLIECSYDLWLLFRKILGMQLQLRFLSTFVTDRRKSEDVPGKFGCLSSRSPLNEILPEFEWSFMVSYELEAKNVRLMIYIHFLLVTGSKGYSYSINRGVSYLCKACDRLLWWAKLIVSFAVWFPYKSSSSNVLVLWGQQSPFDSTTILWEMEDGNWQPKL